MRKHIFRIIAMAVFVGVVVAFPCFARDIAPRFQGPSRQAQKQKQESMIQKNKYEIIVLGHSRMHYGVNPDLFPTATFNYAFHSESYIGNLEKLKKLHDMGKMPGGVLLCIDPFNFSIPQDQHLQSDTEHKSWHDDIGEKPREFNTGMKSQIVANYQIPAKLMLKWGFAKVRGKHIQPPCIRDSGQLAVFRTSAENQIVGRDTRIFPAQWDAFIELLTLAESANTQIALLQLPSLPSETANYRPEQIRAFKKMIQNVQSRFHDVVYFDYSTNPNYSYADFFDATHLNASGAEKFTRQLIADLETTGFFDRLAPMDKK
jgi:hypothetical protein